MAAKNLSLIHYFGIAAAVAVGVLVARLIVLFVMAQAVEGQIESMGEQARQSTERMVRKADADQRQRITEAQHKRANSKIGKDLARRCAEFTQFYRDHPGDYAAQERDKACERYNAFVEEGRQ